MKRVLMTVLVLALAAAIMGPAFAFAQEPLGVSSTTDMLPALALVASGMLALIGMAVSYVWRRHEEDR